VLLDAGYEMELALQQDAPADDLRSAIEDVVRAAEGLSAFVPSDLPPAIGAALQLAGALAAQLPGKSSAELRTLVRSTITPQSAVFNDAIQSRLSSCPNLEL